jgi:hypothetical protein
MDLDVSHAGDVVRGGVRIPRSSPRACKESYAKILTYVDPQAEHAFGFEGKIVRPGAVVTAAQLWPDDHAPRVPILLECASVPGQGKYGHKRREWLYILWRYHPDEDEWTEIGRSFSVAWEWACELRPLAVRALRESTAPAVLSVNFIEVQRRIRALLDQELEGLERPQRWQVLGILHDQLACRVAEAGCARVSGGSMMHGM